ncbi:MAG: MFS transporter [Chloroflexota bacterium]|nr:MFS transporter [Chloroflexota bacterium]MDE2885367.1 MFS transporter [Chloroflexota bacterium]
MQAPNPQPAASATRSAVSRQALRYPDFRILWFTTGLVAGGVWFQQVTLGWLAYDLSRDAVQVAGVVGIRALPLLLSPLTGVIADRVDRRKLLLVDQALVTLLVFGFTIVLLYDLQQLWHLYVFAFLFGVLWAGNNPVRQVLIANTVPREALMNATAMSSMAFNLMRAIGPAIGGFVIAFLGPGMNFLIQGCLFFLALLMVTRMRTPYYSGDRSQARESSPFQNLKEGFRRVITEPVTRITTAMTFGLSITMLAMVFNQLPVYSAEILLNEDGTYLGLLLMAMGLGGFLGTGLLAVFSAVRRKGQLASVAFALSAVSIIVVALVDVLWMAMVALLLQQMFVQLVMTTNMTVVHTMTPDDLRGRVIGVYQMEIGMMPFWGVVAGVISKVYGVDNAFLVGGIAGLAIIAVATLAFPRYRRLEM